MSPSLVIIIITVVSRVSAHGCLNIIHDFGLYGHLPGIKIPYVCIEAATVAPWNAVHGHLPGSGRLPGTLWYYYYCIQVISPTYEVHVLCWSVIHWKALIRSGSEELNSAEGHVTDAFSTLSRLLICIAQYYCQGFNKIIALWSTNKLVIYKCCSMGMVYH